MLVKDGNVNEFKTKQIFKQYYCIEKDSLQSQAKQQTYQILILFLFSGWLSNKHFTLSNNIVSGLPTICNDRC